MEEHRIYTALKPQYAILGCDRELFLILLIFTGTLLVMSWNIWIILLDALIFALGAFMLKHMGNHDLLLRRVYLNELRYRPCYRACPTLCTRGGWHKC